MIDNSMDKGNINIRFRESEEGAFLCLMGIFKKPEEDDFSVFYEDGLIYVYSHGEKDVIGTYETKTGPYGARVFDYPSNRVIGLVGKELIWFCKGREKAEDWEIVRYGKCLAEYTEAGSITLHGRPWYDFGSIDGGEIGGAAAFVALFYNYRFNSLFRDYFAMDESAFMKKHASLLEPSL